MVVSVAAGRPRAGRWVLAVSPVVTAVVMMVAFGLAAGGAAGSRAATNPSVAVPGLLTAGDAGTGWTATHSGAIGAETSGCFRPKAAMMASYAKSLVGVVLTAPAGVPQVDEMAARYPTTAGATSAFDSVMHALRCAVDMTGAGAAPVVPLPAPGLGDRSAAARVSIRSAGADFVAAQQGAGLVLVVYGSAGLPDAAAVSRLTSRALQRIGP